MHDHVQLDTALESHGAAIAFAQMEGTVAAMRTALGPLSRTASGPPVAPADTPDATAAAGEGAAGTGKHACVCTLSCPACA